MPRPKPTEEDLERRIERAKWLKNFCRENLFTEIRLAEISGVSRRAIQMLKKAQCTPHPDTIRQLLAVAAKYRADTSGLYGEKKKSRRKTAA